MFAWIPRPLRRLLTAVLVMAVGVGGTTVTGAMLAKQVASVPTVVDIPKLPDLQLEPLDDRSIVFDRNERPIAFFSAREDREVVPLGRIPKPLQRAVIGIEDRYFYQHDGINVRATARAMVANTRSGGIEQGGSTITQQLVKIALLGPEQTIQRKLKEASFALRLESQMTKSQILERYLNSIYLGHGAYGVQAASQVYFNKNVWDLNWAENSMLVALIRNPNGYDPIRKPKLAQERRRVVARRLNELGILSNADLCNVVGCPSKGIGAWPLPTSVFKRNEVFKPQTIGASFFVEEIRRQLTSLYAGPDVLYTAGWRIFSTLDPTAQEQAESAVANELPDTNGRFISALAAVEPGTGAVRALVGNSTNDAEGFNFATQGQRQPGSSFKPVVLAAAFDQGISPTDTISGIGPCVFPMPAGAQEPIWTLPNYEGAQGSIDSLQAQTLRSSNCAFARLGQIVGMDKVAHMAEALGLGKKDPNVYSMVVGTALQSPEQMAAAYAAFASDGQFRSPYLIEKVLKSDGKVLYQNEHAANTAMTVDSARNVTCVLRANVVSGTGIEANIGRQEVAGKTGTTNDYTDAWFVGFSPHLATAVWMGSPQGTQDKMDNVRGIKVTGGTYPAKIWRAFMSAYEQDRPNESFKPCPLNHSSEYLKYKNIYDNGCGAYVPEKGKSGRIQRYRCNDDGSAPKRKSSSSSNGD